MSYAPEQITKTQQNNIKRIYKKKLYAHKIILPKVTEILHW